MRPAARAAQSAGEESARGESRVPTAACSSALIGTLISGDANGYRTAPTFSRARAHARTDRFVSRVPAPAL